MQSTFFDSAWKLSMDPQTPVANRSEFDAAQQQRADAFHADQARSQAAKAERDRAQREAKARFDAQADERRKQERAYRERERSERRQSRSGCSDPWSVLGVARDATARTIRAAWIILVKLHHPDHGGDAEKFRLVQSAYDQLARR